MRQQQVLVDPEIGYQRLFLKNSRYPAGAGVAIIPRSVGPAVELHCPDVWRDNAGQYVEERRLASAVLANEADDLTGFDVEIDAIDRSRRLESLVMLRATSFARLEAMAVRSRPL